MLFTVLKITNKEFRKRLQLAAEQESPQVPIILLAAETLLNPTGTLHFSMFPEVYIVPLKTRPGVIVCILSLGLQPNIVQATISP